MTKTLADFLQVSSRQSALGVATAQSRALTWVAKYAGFAVLKEALASPVVKLYTVPSESKTSLILTHTCHTDEKASDVLHLQREDDVPDFKMSRKCRACHEKSWKIDIAPKKSTVRW